VCGAGTVVKRLKSGGFVGSGGEAVEKREGNNRFRKNRLKKGYIVKMKISCGFGWV